MSRTQKILIVVGTLALGVVVVLVDLKLQHRNETDVVPNVARGIQARLTAAGKAKEAALVADACDHGGCRCAEVAGRHGLDVDSHVEVLGMLAVASQMCPANDTTAALHAEAVARSGEDERGKSEARQVLARDPNNPFGLYALALVSYRSGDLPEAMVLARRTIDAGRGPSAHLLAGLIAYTMGNLELAATEFRALLATDPNNVDALFNLALVAQRQNRYTEAREGYLHVVSLDPANTNARYNLAVLAHSIGADDEAHHHLAKFESLAAGDDRLPKLKAILATKGATPPAAPPLSAAVRVPAAPPAAPSVTTEPTR